MRLGLVLCILGTVAVWAFVLTNGVLYVLHGELVSLLAFFWCLVMAMWTTHSTASLWNLERDS